MKLVGVIFLSLYLILGEAPAIEPVGTIGKGYLGRLTFLPRREFASRYVVKTYRDCGPGQRHGACPTSRVVRSTSGQ